MKIKNYAIVFVLSFVCLFAFMATINFVVNPYDIWDTPCIEGISCKKSEAGKKIYFAKAKQWQQSDIKGLILGNSRTEIGINPDSSALPTKNNYNLSIRGASVSVQALYLQNYLQYQKPEYIVLGIDFFSFRQRPGVAAQWPVKNREYLPYNVFGEPSEDYTVSNFKYGLTALFSLPAAMDSLMTIVNQQREVSYLSHNGFDNAIGFETINRVEGVEAAFKNDLAQLDTKFRGQEFSLIASNSINNEFEGLKVIVSLAKKYDIPLYIFINPVHIEYLSLLQDTGHLPLYFMWKQQLVAELAAQGYYDKHVLHDFSGAHSFVLEDVPKGRGQSMKWWFEAGHYRPTLGDYMLSAIITRNEQYQLTPQNVKDKLSIERLYFEQLSNKSN